MTDEQIAREIGISVSTLKRRLRTLADAMGATSRTNLVARALRSAVLDAFRPFVGDELNRSLGAKGPSYISDELEPE